MKSKEQYDKAYAAGEVSDSDFCLVPEIENDSTYIIPINKYHTNQETNYSFSDEYTFNWTEITENITNNIQVICKIYLEDSSEFENYYLNEAFLEAGYIVFSCFKEGNIIGRIQINENGKIIQKDLQNINLNSDSKIINMQKNALHNVQAIEISRDGSGSFFLESENRYDKEKDINIPVAAFYGNDNDDLVVLSRIAKGTSSEDAATVGQLNEVKELIPDIVVGENNSISFNDGIATGENSIAFNGGEAIGDYSIVSGTNEKSVITGIVGSLVADEIEITLPVAKGDISLAFGAGTTAHSAGSRAYGTSSQAGYLGYYFWDINFDTKVITLSTNQKQILTSRKKPTSTILAGWNIGDTISIVNNSPYPMCSKITAIDTSNGTITVDSLPFTSIDDPLVKAPNDRAVIAIPPVRQDSILGQEFDTTRPIGVGEVEIGFGATADGFDNIAAGPVSSAHGFRNTALDTASFVTGRENIGAWGALVGGYKNEVLGDTSFAVGRNHSVTGKNSAALNNNNTASGENSFASGSNTISAGKSSHTEGSGTKVYSNFGHAEGQSTTVGIDGADPANVGVGAHAEGYLTEATGNQSHAEGNQTHATNSQAHAEGFKTQATGQRSHAEGQETVASGNYSHAEGIGTIASGEAQHVSGKYNEEDNNALFIIGNGTKDNPSNIVTVDDTRVIIHGDTTDQYNTSETLLHSDRISVLRYGYDSCQTTLITPDYLENRYQKGDEHNPDENFYAEGILIQPDRINFYKETPFEHGAGDEIDYHIEATIEELTAQDVSKLHSLPTKFIGRPGEGENAEVFNGTSKAYGARSHAEGGSTIAYGNFSHTEGQQTIAGEEGADPANVGLGAHAEGMFTLARGSRSHAEGNRTVAYGAQGHAEGTKTVALGDYTHAEGQSSYPALGSPRAADDDPALFAPDADNDTIHEAWKTKKFSLAKGDASHVEGLNNLALGGKSHVEGSNNIASADYQHVQGKFNEKDNSKVHIVGWGDSESNRKNIHTIDKEGNAYFAGSINASKYLINGKQFNMDWNINDESQMGYIKNRTHYTIVDTSIQGEYYNDVIDSSTAEIAFFNGESEIRPNLEIGGEYKLVIDDQIYPVVLNQYTNPELDESVDNYYTYVQLTSLDKPLPYDLIITQGTNVTGFKPDRPFNISFNTNLVDSFNLILCDEYEPAQVKHLDEKYIPETIARKTDIQKYIDEAILGGEW